MKNFFFIILLCISSFAAEKPQILLDSISQHAIRIGNGNSYNVYVFVDPMCIHSQIYIDEITEKKELHKDNSYYIFLYRLDKFDSTELIEFIYQAKNPKLALEDIMIRDKEVDTFDLSVSKKTLKIIEEVALVGQKLEAEHRPFIIKLPRKMDP